MEIFTIDRNFYKKQELIEGFTSCIWTERFYGDDEFELVVPVTQDMLWKLPMGSLLKESSSDIPMIIETIEIDDDKNSMKATGTGLLPWMNNRFIRATAEPADKIWSPGDNPPGWYLRNILWNWCGESDYLNGIIPMGIPNPQKLKIPGLGILSVNLSGPNINAAVPYGPVYDAMKAIANANEMGMRLSLEEPPSIYENGRLLFSAYKGLDRTSRQSANPLVRFSSDVDALTGAKELQSWKNFRNLAFAYCKPNEELSPPPGQWSAPGYTMWSTGFEVRAVMIQVEDITDDQTEWSEADYHLWLDQRARNALVEHPNIRSVDGTINPASQYQYGRDYFLGDLVEVEGKNGVVSISRITEYIRSQDQAGEKAYPTMDVVE